MTRFLALVVLFCVVASPGAVRADQNDVKLNDLFSRLLAAEDFSEAATIERTIWAIWTKHDDAEIDKRMSVGIKAMSGGALKLSLMAFNEIVEMDPAYAEGWNKRATVYYLMGKFEASVRDIRATLALEPRHFGALSGMGLIYSAIGKDEAALNVWEKALTINPHMPGIKARVEELRKKLKGEPT